MSEFAAEMFREIPNAAAERCTHCGQPRRGHGQINDAKVCHTGAPFPDCYRLVTVYGETLGQRHPHRLRERIVAAVESVASDRSYDSAEEITEAYLAAARIAAGVTQ